MDQHEVRQMEHLCPAHYNPQFRRRMSESDMVCFWYPTCFVYIYILCTVSTMRVQMETNSLQVSKWNVDCFGEVYEWISQLSEFQNLQRET